MTSIDLFWVGIWIFLGIFAFQISKSIPFLKSTVNAFSLILILNIFLTTGISGVSSTLASELLTSFTSTIGYLFTANISRSIRMGKISSLLFGYGVVLFVLLQSFPLEF